LRRLLLSAPSAESKKIARLSVLCASAVKENEAPGGSLQATETAPHLKTRNAADGIEGTQRLL